MKMNYKLALAIVGLLSAFSSYAQIAVTGGYTAQQLANYLAGPNITVSNAVLTGSNVASGQFTYSGAGFPMNSGVILSTGNVNTSPGPNGSAGGGTGAQYNLNTTGTAQMTTLGGATSYDAITLEFDFALQSSSIEFNYIFASEEYPEYAPPNSSSYNDVFAFYISGPGITGEENIALVPSTTNAVSINNINPVTNSQYYVNNSGGQAVQFDGYTTLLTAQRLNLTACQTYHLKFVIADIGDHIYNSAVFLQENSFVQGDIINAATQTVNSDGIALEGCIKGQFNFALANPASQDVTINYTIGGSAVNGVDYAFLDNSITIPSGSSTGTIYIDAFSDGLTEGAETVTLTYSPSLCAAPQTITLTINDAQPIDFTMNGTNLDCYQDNSGEILVNATGGFPAYTYYVTNPSGTTTTYTSNPITGLPAGQYSVQVHDTYGCKAEALVIGGQFNAGTTFLPDGSGVTYQAPLVISGFNPGQTITNISQIQQICLTMEHSYLGDLWIRVQSPSGQIVDLKPQNGGGSCDLGEPIATGPVDGTGSSDITPGTGYEYCFNANPSYGTMVNESGNFTRNYTDGVGNSYTDTYLPAGSYTASGNFSSLVGSQMNGTWTVLVTDQYGLDNGYIFNWYISLIGDLPDTTVILTQPTEMTVSGIANNATCGSANGSVNVSVLNGVAPVTYSWSNGATTEDLANVAAGTYVLTATDGNGCQSVETFIVNNIGTLAITSSSTPVTCFGGNNGSISITPSGGTTPYSFAWSNGATTQNISSLTAGNYTVTMTDQLGCLFSQQIAVSSNAQVTATLVSSQDEQCNTTNGLIDVNVSGGNGSYGYAWSNGATTQDLSSLNSGTYNITVTDGLGCTGTGSFTIANNLTGCSNFCFLDVNQNSLTNSTCGGSTGAINIDVLNAAAPYTISWSSGATTEDISGLVPGTYQVTVIDVNNCSQTESFTISNNSNGFAVSSATVSDEMCGNSNGAIDITVTGGSAPYSYSWSNGSTSQDIQGLAEGTYTVTITSASGCVITSTHTVANNTGSLAVNGNVNSAICSSSNGSITQTVTGANGAVSYLWNSGATTQNRTNLAPGTYSCVITDNSGCSLTNSYTVGQTSGNVSLSGTLVSNEVCNNNQGAINITVTGSGLSYLWSNGATTEDLTGLIAGNYSCTVSNAQGCSINTGLITVINTAGNLIVSNQTITDELCGNNAGAININVTGGTSPYTYAWSNGSTSQDITGLTAGLYTLQVSDNNGCSQAHSVTIQDVSGSLSISNAVLTHESCVGGVGTNGQGAINITLAGGTAPFTYLWSNGATTQDVTGLTAGNYTVTVNSNNGCSLTQSYTILVNGSNMAITSSSISDESCGSATGSIDVTLTSNSGPYNYSWSNGSSTEDISNLSAGTYTLTVSNAAGCQLIQSYTVSNDPGTLAVTGVVTNETCGNQNGQVNVSVNGGNSPYQYTWSNGAITQDLTSLSAGTYNLVLSDVYGCSVNYSGTVTNIANGLSASITNVTNENCGQGNGAVNATVTGATSYLWSNGASTEDLTNVSAGTYTLTATDGTGCSTSIDATVGNQTGSLAISFTNVQNETCGNGQGFIDIQTTGTGPFTYSWNTGASTQDILNLSSGTYSVTITDGLGCQLTQSFTLGNTNQSNVSANSVVTDAFCTSSNGAIDISVVSGILPFTYSWNTGATTEDISLIAPGMYTITITDGANCQTTQNISVGSQNSGLHYNYLEIYNDFCMSGQGQIIFHTNGTADNFYINGVDIGGQVSNPLMAGTYNLTITDNYGCSLDTTAVVGNDASFTLMSTPTNATCGSSNGSINIDVFGNGPFTYSWSNGATTEDISNLAPGTYTVTVSETGGFCTDELTVIVGNDVDFVITGTTGSDYCGQGSGSINQTVISGSGLIYAWSNGATTEDVSGLVYGTYTCDVTFPGGCTETYSYTVGNTTNGTVVSSSVINEVCGDGSGAIDLTLNGGTGPFDFTWSTTATTEDISSLSAGTYDITIVDQNDGCTFTETYTIVNDVTIFNTTAVITNSTCSSCTEGSINLTLPTTTTYTYDWSNGATSQDISSLTPGTYTVNITSAEGCDTTITYTILNTAGIDEIAGLGLEMKVYPNPASISFTVDLILPEGREGFIEITDMIGKIIQIENVTNSGTFVFNSTQMNEGVYFVTFRSGSEVKMERIVISGK